MRTAGRASCPFDKRCCCDAPIAGDAERCPRCGVRYVGRTWLEGCRDAAIAAIPWLLLVGVIGYIVVGVVAWLQRFAD